jgi:hypothetical protein
MSKIETTPKSEEKTPPKIQIPSLGTKPFPSCANQINQREGKEVGRAPSLEEASLAMSVCFKMNETWAFYNATTTFFQ